MSWPSVTLIVASHLLLREFLAQPMIGLSCRRPSFPHPPQGTILVFLKFFFCALNVYTSSCDWCNMHAGKFYLVDAGYPNRPGYLSPYKGCKYHQQQWRRGPAPSGEREVFNKAHSSLRSVIEQSFGVLKMKWRLLLAVPSYPNVPKPK